MWKRNAPMGRGPLEHKGDTIAQGKEENLAACQLQLANSWQPAVISCQTQQNSCQILDFVVMLRGQVGKLLTNLQKLAILSLKRLPCKGAVSCKRKS